MGVEWELLDGTGEARGRRRAGTRVRGCRGYGGAARRRRGQLCCPMEEGRSRLGAAGTGRVLGVMMARVHDL